MTTARANDEAAKQYDVLIAGGGPVGLGLAIDLGQRGLSVCVVERHRDVQPIPKGQNLTQRTMEHMMAWGAEARIRAACPIPKDYGIGGLTAYGTLLSGYHYDWLQRQLVRPYYYTDNERLPQYDTERVLRERAAALHTLEARYGWTALGHVQGRDEVALSIRETDGAETRTLRGRYLVGCEGSRSRVRGEAGIARTKRDHDKLMVLLVFKSEGLHRLLERFPGKSFYNVLHPDLDGYWQFLGRVDLGATWFFHAPVPMGTTADNTDFTAYLHKAVGAEFEVALEHIGFWDLRIAIADRYRAGRVFIAGDAAHSHPPYGGYGINAGFEDARNLGWKLEAVLRGQAPDALLDSYDEERRPVFESTARDFIEKSIASDRDFLRAYDPAVDRAAFEAAWSRRASGAVAEINAFEPHYAGSSIVDGAPRAVCGAVGEHGFAARPGHHLAPRARADGSDMADALSAGFTLILYDVSDAEARRAAALTKQAGMAVEIVREQGPSACADYAARFILVRPDHFVSWTSNDDVEGLARALRRSLARSAGKRGESVPVAV